MGGDAPVCVQSMLNKPTRDIEGNVRQAQALVEAGCELIRVAIPNREAVPIITVLKAQIAVPIVADIHFDYRIALDCVAAGVDKIRINPGNIGAKERVKAVAEVCKARGIPIRVGVNAGSLEKHILAEYGAPTPEALCASALYHAQLLEQFDFTDIVLSLKSSSVQDTVEAYRLIAEKCNYPLHIGVTEAGTQYHGILKSAAAMGALLLEGIGDTLRVSLTADPIEEVKAGKDILNAIGLRREKLQVIACPTCARTQIDIIRLAETVEKQLAHINTPLTVAIMGCAVNGPGEASHADIGIAGGDGCALLFRKGGIVRKIPEEQILSALLEEVEIMIKEEHKLG